ncbi:MAG TPA: uracil-DNA glycosylase family protein [Puia sp.]|nr:uracil-DNA glycosylase family protein [Puia sp.]
MPERFTTQSAAILDFYTRLKPCFTLPEGISIMNPFTEPATWKLTRAFYEKFYGDAHPRVFIFGINPGRFGGGVTGVPFTDPIRLQEKCGIPNDWKKLPELSSQFIYEMIDGFGGVEAFYRQFFFTALSPLGYTLNGKNLNYYDDKALLKASEPFMLDCIRQQLESMPTISTCFCLGEGENFKQFSRINEKHRFFDKIIPLPHPRWVMQYRRKKMKEYVDVYVGKLKDPHTIIS